MGLDKSYITGYNKNYYRAGIASLGYCMSWLSPLLNSLIFKNNFIELFLVLAFYFLIKSKHPASLVMVTEIKGKVLQRIFIVVFLFGILGFILSDYDFPDVYADFRSTLVFFFILFLFRSKEWKGQYKESFMIDLLIVVSLMDIVALSLRPYAGQIFTKQNISIVAPSILSIYYLKKQKFTLSFFFTALMSYEAVVAFFRNYYFISVLTYVLLVYIVLQRIYLKREKFSNKIRSISLLVLMVVVGIYASSFIYNYWMSDGSKMIHSINRTEEFLNGENEETERSNSVTVVLNEPWRTFLPHGIGWRAFQKQIAQEFRDVHIISSMDSCFFYLAYHYGLLILVLFLIWSMIDITKGLSRKVSPDLIFSKPIRLGFLILFCASFFTQGAIFAVIQPAFIYAVLYSIILKPF